ncbi:MAG: hypothetical protein ABI847_21455, partial [Anaerolineales bacterium]
LREMVIGVGLRDGRRLVRAAQTMGIILPGADLARLEQAEAQLFERFWGKDMAELRRINMTEMREFTREFRDLIYEMPFQVPEDLILLGRTVAILSGMSTGLNPQFNVWTGLEPYAQKMIAGEASAAGLDFWLKEIGSWLRTLVALPPQLESVLGRLERGEIEVRLPSLNQQVNSLDRSLRRLLAGIVFATLLLSGTQFYLAGHMLAGEALLVAAGVALVWTVFFAR